MLLVICAGLVVLNQTLVWYYNAEFLMHPCELCGELNPHIEKCIDDYVNETKQAEELDWWFNGSIEKVS